jgi:aquaporin Z
MMEATLLGLFMLSACDFTIFLEHPGSPGFRAVADPFTRRALIGLAMGATAIGLIYSPMGRRSGAHFNPAVTLTYFRLGKIRRTDATCYIVAQFIGGVVGVTLVMATAGVLAAAPSVRFAETRPAMGALGPALIAEFAISFLTMTAVLVTSNIRSLAPFTGIMCGILVACYVTFESPISGFSMNPARSFASAVGAWDWQFLWIYFVAPPLGMLAASEVYVRVRGGQVFCAKLNHSGPSRCIFQCDYHALQEG